MVRIEGGLAKGDTLTFEVTANFIVDYYNGTKSLVVSNTGDLGGNMSYWAQSMTTVGIVVLVLALILAVSLCCCSFYTLFAAGLLLTLLLCSLLLPPLLYAGLALLCFSNELRLGTCVVCVECVVASLFCLLYTSTDYFTDFHA